MPDLSRRRFLESLAILSAAGAAGKAGAETVELDTEAIRNAEELAGLSFNQEQRDLMLSTVKEHREAFEALRNIPVPNHVAPTLEFTPPAPPRLSGARAKVAYPDAPKNWQARLPFLSLLELGGLMRKGHITSTALTQMYLGRLKRYDDQLQCVINLTEKRALERARQADQELSGGRDRGPLHGIPWGAKDLLATRAYPTTWGAKPFKDQIVDLDAAVVERLDKAGAVLVAKLSVGALAWGDVWFGGTTKNPWNLKQGSSGSSAGPASATVAGCVAFSIGTETLGSIVSPSQRCGATGLRPTFGRVSRYGCMALSWSMDKIGPICRSAEDSALVLAAIAGPDPRDGECADAPFSWNASRSRTGITRAFQELRVGYDPESFSEEDNDYELHRQALDTFKKAGAELKEVKLPELPARQMTFILEAESAAAFDDLTRSGRDAELVRQVEQAWPNVFRAARLIPAVEYIQANRIRRLLIQQFQASLQEVDVYVHSPYGGRTLAATNLTGHPCITMPAGFRADGTPASICVTGQLWREDQVALAGLAYQHQTEWHLRHPPLMGHTVGGKSEG